MLSAGVQKEKRGKMPPISAPGSIFEHFGSLLDAILSPRGGAEGAVDVHLGLSVSRVAPQWPPDRFLDHFGSHFGTTLETQIEEK